MLKKLATEYPIWEPSKVYKLEDIVMVSANRNKVLICIKPGTSSKNFPPIRSNGARVTDGDIAWGTINLEGNN